MLLADPVVAAYDIPANSSGLAWDGRLLWFGGVGEGGDWIRAFDPESGSIVDSLPAPIPDCYGLAWFQGRLAYLSPRSDSIYLVSRDAPVQHIANPYPHMGGLAVDGATIWTASNSQPARTLIQLDRAGRVLRSMPFTSRQSRDLAYHRGQLFVADRLFQQVRVITPQSGRLTRIFSTPGSNPDGITSDGEYVWLIDSGGKSGDRLYKLLVRQGGGIRLSALAHNYCSVVIDHEIIWTLWVYNDGFHTAELIDFEVEGNDDIIVPHWYAFPEHIQPGDSVGLRISFRPAYRDSVHINLKLTYDIDHVENWVNLRGKGVRPGREIVIAQRELDFGMTRHGFHIRSSNLQHLLLENNGGEPLTVSELRFTDDSFFAGFYDFPYTFEEPGLYPIPIFFRPNRSGPGIYATLTIVSDDENHREIMVGLRGDPFTDNYSGGTVLWRVVLGDDIPDPRVRAIQDIDDVTGDGLADVIIASNDYQVQCFHAAATHHATPIWCYRTDINPWRSGLVAGQAGMSEGGDWDNDGTGDIVFGLDGGAMTVVALSGRTGREIWIFDAHAMRGGGGEVRVAQAEFDLTDDGVRDVFAAAAGPDVQHTTDALFLLDGRDGSLVWMTELESAPIDARAMDDVTGDTVKDIAMVCEDGTVFAVDGNRGQVVWDNQVEGSICCMLVMDDVNGEGSQDLAIITSMHGISMFNGSNGVLLWYIAPGNRLTNFTAGAALNDVRGNGSDSPDFVVGDGNNFVRAIDGRTSVSCWDTTYNAGSPVVSMASLDDLNHDGRKDFMVGTLAGRLFALSGNGKDGLWSFHNIGPGHAFTLINPSRDIDGNEQMDVFAAMANGTVYCFAGTYVGENDVPEGDDDDALLPKTLLVYPAFPNPFNSAVRLPFQLNRPAEVTLKVMDLMGRQVFTCRNGPLPVGTHQLHWSGGNAAGIPVPSGIYFLKVEAEHSSEGAALVRSVYLVR